MDYLQMMDRFAAEYSIIPKSSQDKAQIALPKKTKSDEFSDGVPRKKQLPLEAPSSSSDIQILGQMLLALRKSAEQHLRIPIYLAIATHPQLPNLDHSTLQQAFNYAGLANIESYKYFSKKVSELSTAYAALGYGMCEHWTDIRVCELYDADFEEEYTLAISFTDTSLTLTSVSIIGAHDLRGSNWATANLDYTSLPNLSMDQRKGNEEDIHFWPKVREAIVTHIVKLRIPQRVILLGDQTENREFLQSVEDAFIAIGAWQLVYQVRNITYDPLFLAARGAAEFAKCWQGSTWNCIEQKYCAKERDHDVEHWTREQYHQAVRHW
ncbi:uncharacterized protein LY89DRAFT_739739 [Mollisia scopiformis]|uniref:Uncharacterized protein n=1 Tax=Mollisia scopiformis TaxID=149040 RepID=A0A194WRZ2_MOLSC|nr:uncharacterized protein LY89DRAFT_739739 [Mollisia scopiformis]KUJ10746.1 hypothetical protein LY89DRAFT_739739 [Mollisia scopiformis]